MRPAARKSIIVTPKFVGFQMCRSPIRRTYFDVIEISPHRTKRPQRRGLDQDPDADSGDEAARQVRPPSPEEAAQDHLREDRGHDRHEGRGVFEDPLRRSAAHEPRGGGVVFQDAEGGVPEGEDDGHEKRSLKAAVFPDELVPHGEERAEQDG